MSIFLKSPDCVAMAAQNSNSQKLLGFVLTRRIIDEAEILTIAVTDIMRSQGLGHALCLQCFDLLAKHGTSKIFLEVREDNFPAQALYKKLGFVKTGQRRNYYGRTSPINAITMTLFIPENHPAK